MNSFFYFAITLGILILVHEWGHFIVARINKIFVEEFSIGFGPRLIAKKWGETLWKISLLPFGGFVKMKGEDPDDETSAPDSFSSKPLRVRLAVVLGGPTMNILFCILVMPLVFMIGMNVPESDPAVVESVIADSPAAKAGLIAGDQIVSIGGQPIATWSQLVTEIQKGESLPLEVLRDGATKKMELTPQWSEEAHRFVMGIQKREPPMVFKRYGPLESISMGLAETWKLTKLTGDILKKLFTGDLSYKSLSGPLGIAKASAMVAEKGLGTFLHFMAFLSLQLGILNLLPIPVLDGGHILFMGIEAIRGKALTARIRATAQVIGMVMLMSLMLLVTINDAEMLWGFKKWIHTLSSRFF